MACSSGLTFIYKRTINLASNPNPPPSQQRKMEVIPFWALYTLSLVFLITFLSKFLFPKTHFQKLPPGPKPWPIIGNLNLIGDLPHQSLHKLSQKYGPLMQLKFGSFPVVVASSADMAQLFLKTYDHVFASRPLLAAGKYTTYNNSNITWAPYGPYWRQGRKFCLTELFSSKRLDSYEYIRVEEMRAYMSRLFALSGKPVALKEHLSHATLSVISRMVLGKKYFSETESSTTDTSLSSSVVKLEEFQEMMDELFLLNGVFNIGDWIPWLKFLDLQGYEKRMKALKKRLDRFHDHVLDEHNAKRVNGMKDDFVAKDMVDLLLELAHNPDVEVKLSYDNVKGFIQDLIAAGTDSSASTVEWAMSELLKNPKLIEKATEELNRVIGKNRWVSEKDLSELPYIDAITKETLRKHPVAVLLAPHLALEDCNVDGYDISKGTPVFINAWSMGRDPSVWDEPEEFRPERFLGKHKNIDVKGHSFELVPFGSGRRRCAGYSLAMKLISSSLANLLHGFNWKLCGTDQKAEDLGMEELYGLATVRKFPLVAVMEPRLPDHVYQF